MSVYQDPSGRTAGKWALRRRGVALAIVIVIGAVFINAYAQGRFADRFALTIDVAQIGEGLNPGAEVKFRGLAIGEVTGIETMGLDHQRLDIEIGREHAAALTENLAARFTSSNLFGSTAIELENRGSGGPLKEHTVLSIGENSTNTTVTGVFRRSGRLTRVLDTDEARYLFDVVIDNAELLGPLVQAFVDTARTLADNQRNSVAHYLRIGNEVAHGSSELIPSLTTQILALLDGSGYFEDKTNRARTRGALSGLIDELVVPLGNTLRDNKAELATVLDTVLDLALPLAGSLGNAVSAYDRLPALIDRVGDALPVVDGKVQLQLELIVEGVPQVARSVVGVQEGATR